MRTPALIDATSGLLLLYDTAPLLALVAEIGYGPVVIFATLGGEELHDNVGVVVAAAIPVLIPSVWGTRS